MSSTSWLSRAVSTFVLSLPVAVWASDCICSVYTIRGSSMEPSLRDGDVILVKKADVSLPFGIASHPSDEEDLMVRARIQRLEHGHSAARAVAVFVQPPLVLPGDVVVFCNPTTAFPNEYNIKRVVGVSGQMVMPRDRFRSIETIPSFNMWVEGDNGDNINSEDSNTYGVVSKKLLVGQAKRIVWPPSRWGPIHNIRPPQGRAWWG